MMFNDGRKNENNADGSARSFANKNGDAERFGILDSEFSEHG
jgi:hypothetical protein